MLKLITLKSRVLNRISKFILESGKVELGDFIVFETDDEEGFGEVIEIKLINKMSSDLQSLKKIHARVAETNDFEQINKLAKSEKKALEFIKNEISNYFEFIKIINVEYSFNKKKIYIYFYSEERVDFKILINFLFKKLKVWIEFKQLSARELSKIFGGIGVCGRVVCCKSFLKNTKKLNASSIVNQNVCIDGIKYSGVCGRLMCCLEYEEKTYSEVLKTMPKIGSIIKTPKGTGVVISVNAVSQMVQTSISGDTSFNLWIKNSDIESIN